MSNAAQHTPPADTPWVSASDSNGTCLEFRRHHGAIEFRDTKDREGPRLRFTRAEFEAFLAGARAGRFDDLV